jgi:thiol-disulfide isomerase/thioredoxin
LIILALVLSSIWSRGPESTTTDSTPGASTQPASTTTGLKPLAEIIKNTEMKALDGSTFKINDYAGKVLILDLWASWCGPCRDEIPHLMSLRKEYESRGLEVVGITIEDPQEAAESVKAFVRDLNVDYKVGWADREVALEILKVRDGIPQTLVITRDGFIQAHIYGFDPYRTPARLKEAVEEAISKS